jgi:hypothetical protein
MDQRDLFSDIEGLRRSLAKLLPELPPRGQDWRPREGMRSVWELATHLVQVPAVDVLISREGSIEEVHALEQALTADTPEGLLALFDTGVETARSRFGAMSPEAFEGTVTRAFYGHAMPAKGWLLEIVTHLHHHRAMLHTYLKIMGRPVDMSYLYV